MTVRRWGAEEQVNGGWTGFQGEPDLAALPDGGFVVAWMDRADPSLAVMRFQRFDSAGEPAGLEGQVPVAGAWSSLTLTVLADGGWLIGAELAGVGEDRGIQAFRFDAQGGYLGGQVLDPFGAPATGAPVTAAFGTGFVAVQERNGDLIGTWYDATGTVVGGEVTVNGTTVGAQRHADVTALAQGGFAAVWTDMNIGRAQFRIFDQNGYPVTPEDVPANSSSLGGNAGHASIAALAGGGLVIAWETSTPLFPGAAPDIRARIFTATGAPVGMDFVVNANTLGPQTTPEVAGLRSGGFVVVWADLASGPGLRGQVFDAWGLRDGGEFTINTGPLPSDIVAGDISLAELSDGRIAVAWRGLDDGGSGILRQIIDPRDGVVEGTAADDGLWGNDAWGDEISGYAGQDRLSGLRGDDVLFGGDGGDVLRGGRGDDLLYGNRGDDTLLGDAGADDLYGGAGFDTASFAGLFAVSLALDGSLEGEGSARGDLFRGIERVEGSEAGDLLRGSSASETLVGAGGDDRLEGGRGDDLLEGGAGDDRLEGGAGLDRLDGGTGSDLASYAGAAAGIVLALDGSLAATGEAGGDLLSGIEGIEGSAFADRLRGDAGGNTLRGGGGQDSLEGMGGNDLLDGGEDDDALLGGAGADRIAGGAGADRALFEGAVTASLDGTLAGMGEAAGDTFSGIEALFGSALADRLRGDAGANLLAGGEGADTLEGQAGADSLEGGGGDDWLLGGAGTDSLRGGAGADDFVFTSLADSAGDATRDRIADFAAGQDDLVLSALDARAGVAGNQAFVLDLDGSFSEGEVRQVLGSGQLRIEVNTDTDATPELSVLLLGVSVRLMAGDFLL